MEGSVLVASLNIDLINYLHLFISNYTLNYFLSVNKQMYKFKQIIKFSDVIILSNKIFNLPYYDSFTALEINYLFDLPIDSVFRYPLALKYLRLRKEIIRSIPGTVISLIVEHNFKNLIIPESVKYLYLSSYNKSHIYAIPNTVKKLVLDEHYQENNGIVLPNSLTHFMFSANNRCCYDNVVMPNALEYLFLDDPIDYYEKFFPELKYKNYHSCDKYLDWYNLSLNNLTKLKYLDTGKFFNSKIQPDTFPSSITHLTLGKSFNQNLTNIPLSVTHLTIKNPNFLYHATSTHNFELIINK